MQLQVTRDLKTRSLKLGLELSVHELAALQRAELLTYDLYNGHSVADLQMGWAGICTTVGEMVDIEHGVRAKLDAMRPYFQDADPPGEEHVVSAEHTEEVPPHTHPHDERSINLILTVGIVFGIVFFIFVTRTEMLFQSLNKVVHAW